MTKLATFLAINAAFVGANVAGAGVFRVLGEVANGAIQDADLVVWPWILIGIASAGAAVVFLIGLIEAGNSMLKTIGWKL